MFLRRAARALFSNILDVNRFGTLSAIHAQLPQFNLTKIAVLWVVLQLGRPVVVVKVPLQIVKERNLEVSRGIGTGKVYTIK